MQKAVKHGANESAFQVGKLFQARSLLRLADALGNLNRTEFAGLSAGDIDDPRGLTFFAGNQQPVAIR